MTLFYPESIIPQEKRKYRERLLMRIILTAMSSSAPFVAPGFQVLPRLVKVQFKDALANITHDSPWEHWHLSDLLASRGQRSEE